MSLYDQLQSASAPERGAIAERLIRGMQAGDPTANEAYWHICEQVIVDHDAHETEEDEALPRWEFSPSNSALLVRNQNRVQGYLRAIARAPQARSVIDAGCGSSALLAVGTATTHPRAEVIAYEINPQAAACARTMVGLMGLSDRIHVETGDVLAADLPEVDRADTETFAAGLTVEPGLRIAAALGRVAHQILPARVRLYACDEAVGPRTAWQSVCDLDLR
jgi:hypothetical protein